MKKQKLPKYVRQLFEKPQFKIGDLVRYEFLGDRGWGLITKINKFNDTIIYMVKGRGYTYPCGIQIKEYSSYYAGSIDIETSNDQSINATTRNNKIKKQINNSTRKRVSGSDSNSISNSKTKHRAENNIRDGNGKHIKPNSKSQNTINSVELEKEIEKQKNFLRRFS